MAPLATRKIVRIDEEKCDGCGECAPRCAEGAIRLVDGKARLIADVYCDGLGACLGHCPRGAISIEERLAAAFDESAVERRQRELGLPVGARAQSTEDATDPPGALAGHGAPVGGCPGAAFRDLSVLQPRAPTPRTRGGPAPASRDTEPGESRLTHWPVQLALVPVVGPLWQGADVLLAADCVPFALPEFHESLLAGKSLAIACPKLDDPRLHLEKLARIFEANSIRSVTVAHMEVPCCSGIVVAARLALERAGKDDLPFHDITVGIDGRILGTTAKSLAP